MKAQTQLERTKQAWRKQWEEENLDTDVRRLINQATFDLWYGPGVGDDDNDAPRYPGFGPACDQIKAALASLPSTLYLFDDWEGWSETEPEAHPCDECGGTAIDSEDAEDRCPYCVRGSVEPDPYYALDRSEVVRIIVGKELAEYIR
jgi:hypothetical protein